MDGLTVWFRAVLEISLAMSLVLPLLLLCRPFFKHRYQAKWAYWAWLLVAVRLLIPVNFSLPSVTPVSIPEPGVSVNLPVAFERKNKAPLEALPSQPEGDSAFAEGASWDLAADDPLPIKASVVMDGWTVVAWVWLVGAACALMLQLVPYFRFRRQVRRWSTAVSAPEFDALRAELNAPGLKLARCPAVLSPMVSGFFRPTLLLPAEGELPPEPILRHEIVHYKCRDLWYKLVLLVAECVHWFNPLVWLMGAAANRDLERACDEKVTEGRSEEYRAGYGRAILDAVDVAQPRPSPLTSYFHGGKSAMLERLSSILNTEGKKQGAAVLCLLLAAAILGSAFFAVGRSVVMEDDEYQIILPYGTTWERPEFKPGLNAKFYRNGVEAGGLVGISGSLDEMQTLWQGESIEYAMFGSSPLGSKTIPQWEGELKRVGVPYEEVHYYLYVAENQICDLWFRLDMVSRKEADAAAESFLKNLGASHAQSPDKRYDLSYLLTDEGSRWLLRDRGELVGAVTTPGNYAWQTAQWSPNGQWASVRSTEGLVLLTPGPAGLTAKVFSGAYDDATPIEFGKDNRMQFSYVIDSGETLEGGTAWYDPAEDAVEDVVAEAVCALVSYRPIRASGAARPEWTVPLPADVTVVRNGEDGDADLMRGNEKIGLVRWGELSQNEKTGRNGLSMVYTDFDELGGGAAFGYTFPVGDSGGYKLVLRESALRQDLANAMAHRVLVDGEPVFQYVYEGDAGDAVMLEISYVQGVDYARSTWYNGAAAEIMYGTMFSLKVLKDGAWEIVSPAEDLIFTTLGHMLKPDESRAYNYPIKDFYGDLPAGQYRICAPYSIHLGLGKYSEEMTVYGEFTVE